MPDYSKLSKPERRKLQKEIKEVARKATDPSVRLPASVAQSNSIQDEGEKNFTIGHRFYRDDLCQGKTIPKTAPLRKVIEAYKNMCRCSSEQDVYNLPFDVKKVKVANHYKKYASGLTPDAELSEFDAGSYRGFFFIDRSAHIVEMIAVDIHPEDKKQKR
ncbi:MAG: hypothetical protein ACREGJ_00900 [Candidatus Saccharimonadales bacterium]